MDNVIQIQIEILFLLWTCINMDTGLFLETLILIDNISILPKTPSKQKAGKRLQSIRPDKDRQETETPIAQQKKKILSFVVRYSVEYWHKCVYVQIVYFYFYLCLYCFFCNQVHLGGQTTVSTTATHIVYLNYIGRSGLSEKRFKGVCTFMFARVSSLLFRFVLFLSKFQLKLVAVLLYVVM